jgi:hypothetical protein
MTEAEWLACDDLYSMLEFLRDRVSDRKLRLFAVACCRRPYYRVDDERHRRAIQFAERMADEAVSEGEWREVRQAALELWQAAWADSLEAQQQAPRGTPEVEKLVHADMATAAGWAILEDAWEAAYQATGVDWGEDYADEPAHQLVLLRDVFGPPLFRPVPIDPAWLGADGGAAPALARRIYNDRAFHDLPVLAGALERAGCADPDMLSHCRQPSEHVRGCWVVDLILGKS